MIIGIESTSGMYVCSGKFIDFIVGFRSFGVGVAYLGVFGIMSV